MKKEDRKLKETKFKRGIILDAAKTIFKRNGINKTTIANIANEAGFAKGTFYLYFKSKDEIISAIFLENEHLFNQTISKIAKKQISAQEKLFKSAQAFYISHVELIDKYKMKQYFKRLSDLEKILTGEYLTEIQTIEKNINTIFINIIKQGQDENIFNPNYDAKSITLIIHSLMDGLLINLSGMFQDYNHNTLQTKADKDKHLITAFNFIMAALTNKTNINNLEIIENNMEKK